MENSIFPKNKFSVNAQHRRMNSLRTDDISPPRKPIVKPYEYGEGFEELKPKGIAKEDPQKIMNFCLKTNDIQGASPKKIIHVSNTRDLLATEDIDGCQPDPFRNRERTKRFNMKIRKLNRGKNKSVVNGKYSLQSEYSEEDHNKKFAYANHADEGSLKTGKSYILPKYTKEIAKYGKRYYENKNKNGSNIDFSWRDEYYDDEGEGEDFESPKHYFEDNNDYGKILGTSQKSIAPLADQNTPLRRQESQNRELNTILKDDGMNNSQVQMDSINPMNEVENIQQTVIPQNEGRIR